MAGTLRRGSSLPPNHQRRRKRRKCVAHRSARRQLAGFERGGNMCKVRMLRELVKQRLNVAIEEIFELFDQTLADYEEELCRTKAENVRQRELLDAVLKPQAGAHSTDIQQVLVKSQEETPAARREWHSKAEEPSEQLPCIKEEAWSSRDGEELQKPEEDQADVTAFMLTGAVHVKSEDDGAEAQQQLHRRQSEQNTEADAPLSDMDDVMSHSSDTDHSERAKEALDKNSQGSPRHHEDNKQFKCSECGKRFAHKGSLKIHMITHTGEKHFACSFCAKTFYLKHHMNRHMRIHTGEHPYSCSVCAKGFRDKYKLINHMRTHMAEKPFACSLCMKRFSSRECLALHVTTHAEENAKARGSSSQVQSQVVSNFAPLSDADDDDAMSRSSDTDHSDDAKEADTRPDGDGDNSNFICSECGKTFYHKGHLNRHMITHTGEKPFSCSFCAKCFTRKSDLKVHVQVKHTGDKPFKCTVCAKTFPVKRYLITHMRKHNADFPFSCSACGKGFSAKEELETHTATDAECGVSQADDTTPHSSETDHKKNPKGDTVQHTGFICSECGKSFVQKATLNRHMRIHTGEKPFGCTVCGKRFSRNGDLTIHMRTHSAEKPFNCTLCSESFSLKHYLSVHMKRHFADKPFACSVCAKRFNTKAHLKTHMKRHTGEKPFSCEVCGRCFFCKRDVRTHMRTHTGEKPFTCPVCNKGFSTKTYVSMHMRTHTGERLFSCDACHKRFTFKTQVYSHVCTGYKNSNNGTAGL